MKKIAIFASGSGSNAENIAHYFKEHKYIKVALILSNKPDAYVLKRAEKLGIPSLVFNRDDLYRDNKVKKNIVKSRGRFYCAGRILMAGSQLVDQDVS